MTASPRARHLKSWAIAFVLVLATDTIAAPPVIEIEIRNHLFQPDTLTIPANTKVKLIVYNRDTTPEEFESYERTAFAKGFLMASATPLTRSSYHAGDDFARLRAARLAR